MSEGGGSLPSPWADSVTTRKEESLWNAIRLPVANARVF